MTLLGQVYRHLLHNTLMRDGDRLDVRFLGIIFPAYWFQRSGTNMCANKPSVIRLGILLLLFDVYLTWARLEKQTAPDAMPGESNLGKLAQQPIVLQYMFFRECHFLSSLAIIPSCRRFS